ncbi:MAG TPA: sensor histidine kinase [Gaiellaceae bacterium]|nr:sensor histidine kinase [Gaiellaceae bacterium]
MQPDSNRERPSSIPAMALALGIAFSVCAYLVSAFDVAYESTPLHIGIETVGAFAGLTAGVLLLGRAAETRNAGEYLVATALFVLVVENLFFLLLPTALANAHATAFSDWGSSLAQLVEAALLVIAGAVSERRLTASRRLLVVLTVSVSVLLWAGIAVPVHALAGRLPLAVDETLSPVAASTAIPHGSGVLEGLRIATAALFALAAWLLSTRRNVGGARLGVALSTGLVAAALAACNFAVFPSLYSQWVFSGDILQFCFYIVLLVGVGAEMHLYWRRLLEAAVLEERRRIARDLHDGLAQELALIAVRVQELAGADPRESEAVQAIASASDRALAEARSAISALTEPLDRAVARGCLRSARDVIDQNGVRVRTELVGSDFDATPEEREALFRIAHEAATNAVRHGRPTVLRIRLRADRAGRRLRIVDNGSGFALGSPTRGFGLVSMRERASAAGGRLTLRSLAGLGTAIDVFLP